MRRDPASIPVLCMLAFVSAGGLARAQAASQRGFVEARGFVYPQQAPNDDRQAGLDLLLRYELSVRPAPWLTLSGGLDARADSFGQVGREWAVSWDDRTDLRPAIALRRASATVTRGRLSIEVGKQFVRWGKTDVLTPTDRFAPRDFMEVVVNDLLPVAAVRATYERSGRTLDLVWQPRFTPSRLPLSDRRWSVTSGQTEIIAVADGGAEYPGGPQVGARFSHVASGFEYAVSVFDGYNHLPQVEGRLRQRPPQIEMVRVFPRIRAYGGDLAWPTKWFTLKAEAAFFDSSDLRADRYTLAVVQLERQSGEWFFVAGYAGEAIATRRAPASFAPDRGLSRSFLGRASYTIDANRSVAVEGAIRQNGHGTWLKAEYSQALGSHWRATVTANVIRGQEDDFLGQFRRNSNVAAGGRYSF